MDSDQSQAPEYVGFWIRFAAFMINNVLILFLIIPIALLVYGKEFYSQLTGPFGLFLNYGLPAIAFVAFWIYRSAEPGKMVFSAVIVRASDFGRPSNGHRR